MFKIQKQLFFIGVLALSSSICAKVIKQNNTIISLKFWVPNQNNFQIKAYDRSILYAVPGLKKLSFKMTSTVVGHDVIDERTIDMFYFQDDQLHPLISFEGWGDYVDPFLPILQKQYNNQLDLRNDLTEQIKKQNYTDHQLIACARYAYQFNIELLFQAALNMVFEKDKEFLLLSMADNHEIEPIFELVLKKILEKTFKSDVALNATVTEIQNNLELKRLLVEILTKEKELSDHSFDDDKNGFSPLIFTHDNEFLIAGIKNLTSGNSIRLWKVKNNGEDKLWKNSPGWLLGYDNKNNTIVLGSETEIMLIDTDFAPKIHFKHQGTMPCVAYFCNNVLVVGFKDGCIKIFDQHGNIVREIKEEAQVQSITLSPDGKLLAGSYIYNNNVHVVKIWKMNTNELLVSFFLGETTSLQFSSDGKKLAASLQNGLVTLWDVETWQLKAELKSEDPAPITSIAFHSDGNLLAACDQKGTVTVWDLNTQKDIFFLSFGDSIKMNAVTFSPNGRWFAFEDMDSMVEIHPVIGLGVKEDFPVEQLLLLLYIKYQQDNPDWMPTKDLAPRLHAIYKNSFHCKVLIPHTILQKIEAQLT